MPGRGGSGLKGLRALALAALWLACAGVGRAEPAPAAELLEKPYLFEVVRHLYRWHLDEIDVERLAGTQSMEVWVREVGAELDEGDRSRLAEIGLPQLGVVARVKKADYAIEELGVEIRDDRFRIANVARVQPPTEPPEDAAALDLDYGEIRAHLFATRTNAAYPGAETLRRLRGALLEHFRLDTADYEGTEREVHVAPLSPVANELWVFVEQHRMLIHFSADVDLENPALWSHRHLEVRTFDLVEQTVVSMHETPGSNEFLTRDQAGRALYNCMVLGKRMTLGRETPAGGPEAEGGR
jgi:hypothetical protein